MAMELTGDEVRARLEQEGTLNLRGAIITGTLNLAGLSVPRELNLSSVTVDGDCILEGCYFERGAILFDTLFRGCFVANYARFAGIAYFWRARFGGTASFRECRIIRGEAAHGNLYNGEVNFSWAQFVKDCDFFRLNVAGPAFFHRTIFRGDANFDEAKFEAAAHFVGTEHEICLSRREIEKACASAGVYERLVRDGVLRPDSETSDGHYAQLQDVRDRKSFEKRLSELGFEPATRKILLCMYDDQARPMFAPGHTSCLRSLTLEAPRRVRFVHVDMQTCLFASTQLAEVDLVDARWPTRGTFGFLRRLAVHDEDKLDPEYRDEHAQVYMLYRELQANAERRDSIAEVIGFRISELEMRRRYGPRIRAVVLTLYRVLSGYGRDPALALLWLAALVLLIFPAIYMAAKPWADPLTAIRHSVEVVFGMTSAAGQPSGFFAAALSRVEPILVTGQAGLAALSLANWGWKR